MNRKILTGLFGVIGIWLTAGFALPFVNKLDMFEPTQLMAFRGLLAAGVFFVLLRGRVMGVDSYTYLIAIVVPLATLGLFEGSRRMGVGPAIIILTMVPVMNIIIGSFRGRKISQPAVVGILLILGGVVMARWGAKFVLAGFAWAMFGTIMGSILNEVLARAKGNTFQKCFYGSLGMGLLGLALGANSSWDAMRSPDTMLLVIVFAFVGGFLYWIAYAVALENLPTNEASILAQGETPAVIIGAWFLLGEQLTFFQWIGVGIALYGAAYLSLKLSKSR